MRDMTTMGHKIILVLPLSRVVCRYYPVEEEEGEAMMMMVSIMNPLKDTLIIIIVRMGCLYQHPR